MNTTHALLKAHRVPGDVIVDHKPAELEVDPLPGGLGGDENLSIIAKVAFSEDAGAWRVTVANLHATVDPKDHRIRQIHWVRSFEWNGGFRSQFR